MSITNFMKSFNEKNFDDCARMIEEAISLNKMQLVDDFIDCIDFSKIDFLVCNQFEKVLESVKHRLFNWQKFRSRLLNKTYTHLE